MESAAARIIMLLARGAMLLPLLLSTPPALRMKTPSMMSDINNGEAAAAERWCMSILNIIQTESFLLKNRVC